MFTYSRIGQYTTNTLRASCRFCRFVRRFDRVVLVITQNYTRLDNGKKETGGMPISISGMPTFQSRTNGNQFLGGLFPDHKRFNDRIAGDGDDQPVGSVG